MKKNCPAYRDESLHGQKSTRLSNQLAFMKRGSLARALKKFHIIKYCEIR